VCTTHLRTPWGAQDPGYSWMPDTPERWGRRALSLLGRLVRLGSVKGDRPLLISHRLHPEVPVFCRVFSVRHPDSRVPTYISVEVENRCERSSWLEQKFWCLHQFRPARSIPTFMDESTIESDLRSFSLARETSPLRQIRLRLSNHLYNPTKSLPHQSFRPGSTLRAIETPHLLFSRGNVPSGLC
jgi:hypothetical protein